MQAILGITRCFRPEVNIQDLGDAGNVVNDLAEISSEGSQGAVGAIERLGTCAPMFASRPHGRATCRLRLISAGSLGDASPAARTEVAIFLCVGRGPRKVRLQWLPAIERQAAAERVLDHLVAEATARQAKLT